MPDGKDIFADLVAEPADDIFADLVTEHPVLTEEPRIYDEQASYSKQLLGAVVKGGMALGSAVLQLPKHTEWLMKAVPAYHLSKFISEKISPGVTKRNEAKYQELIEQHKSGVAAILKAHPEWESEPPENFLDLLTSPRKLSLALAQSAPLLVGAGILTATGQPGLGVAMMYAAEGQQAYDEAISTPGVTEREAEQAYHLYGSVSAALESMQLRGIMNISKKAWKATAVRTAQKVAGKNLTMNVIKVAAKEAAEEVAQGTWQEATAKMVYDKDVSGGVRGFLDRRAQEALLGFTMGVVPGVGVSAVSRGVSAVQAQVDRLNAGQELTGVDEFFAAEEARKEAELKAGEWTVRGKAAVGDYLVTQTDSEGNVIFKDRFETREEAEQYKQGSEAMLPEEHRGTITIEESIVESTVQKMTRLFGDIQRNTTEQLEMAQKARSQELAKRITTSRDIVESGAEEELYYKGLAPLKKPLPPMPVFKPLEELGAFSVSEMNELRMLIRTNPKMRGFERLNTETAFIKLFKKGELPTPSEISLLEKQFGSEFAKKIRNLRSRGQKTWDMTMDIINAPRTLLASVDVSGPGRQGILVAARHPVLWAKSLGASYKIFFGKESLAVAEQLDTDIRTGKYSDLAMQSGLDLTQWEGVGRSLEKHEEFFMSKFAEKVPLVKRSERAYVVALNKLRMDVFAQTAEQWEGTGKTTKDYKDLAKAINHLTGRGDIKSLKKIAPILNGVFFSPKFVASRIQVPIDIFTTTPAVRKMLLGNLVSFVGTGLGVLGLLSLIKGVKVEKDPRSSDFGKVRIGDVRIDYWAGYTPMVRLVVQLMTGERKATDTGKIYDVDAGEVIGRFIQSKFSPPASLAMDLYKGQDFLGQDLSWEVSEVAEQFYKRLTPLAIQDTADALYYQGLTGGAMAASLAFHGIGVQAYPKTLSKKLDLYRNEISNKFFGKRWDNIGPEAQELLAQEHPQLESMQARITAERNNFDFIGKQLEEQKAAGLAVQNVLPKGVQSQMEALGVSVGGLGRRISSDWFLNDKRYKVYQDITKTLLRRVLPRIITHSNWNTLNETKKRELLNYVIDETKKLARKQIIDTANRNDLISVKDMYAR